MKRIPQSISKGYFRINLYLDDLEYLENILKSEVSEIKIKTKPYEFDSVSELKDQIKEEELKEIEITGTKPYVSLSFGKSTARLYISDDDTKSAGLFYKLDDFLVERQSKTRFIFSYYALYILGVPIYVLSLLKIENTNYSLILLLLWLAWNFLVGYTQLFKVSKINLIKRSEKTNFFIRNKDQLIINLVVAVVSVALTVIFKDLLDVFKKWF